MNEGLYFKPIQAGLNTKRNKACPSGTNHGLELYLAVLAVLAVLGTLAVLDVLAVLVVLAVSVSLLLSPIAERYVLVSSLDVSQSVSQ